MNTVNSKTGGVWITKAFKKAIEKMKVHAKSDTHVKSCEAELLAARARQEGSSISEEEKLKNRKAIKSFLRCTHFLARQHIPQTTNFSKLVSLVVACGGRDLEEWTG